MIEPGQYRHAIQKRINALLFAGTLAMPALPGAALLEDATWDGSAGNTDYNNPLNWDIGLVPFDGNGGDTYNVIIPGGALVDPDGTTTIQALELGPGATLRLMQGDTFRLNADSLNNGTIQFAENGTGNATLMLLENVALDGAGEIQFTTPHFNRVGSNGSNTLTLGADQVMRTVGNGSVGYLQVTTNNQGLITTDNGVISIGRRVTNHGTVRATGTGRISFDSVSSIINYGTLEAVDPDSRIFLDGATVSLGTISGLGTMEMDGTHQFNSVTLDIARTVMDGGNLVLLAGGFTNNGIISMRHEAPFSVEEIRLTQSQSIRGTGEIRFETNGANVVGAGPGFVGTLYHRDGHTIRAAAGSYGEIQSDYVNEGRMILEPGSTIKMLRAFDSGVTGFIGGSGTIQATSFALFNEGTIAPGNSTGTLHYDGTIYNRDTSKLVIEIAGDQAGEFDVLDVTSTFDVDGRLEVVFLNGSQTLQASDSLTIVHAGTLVGATAELAFDSVYVGLGSSGNFDVIYDEVNDTISLTNFSNIIALPSPVVPGDLNGDGTLTNADISPFVVALTDPTGYAAQFPGLDPNEQGDFTGDNALTNGDISGFVAALTGGSTVVASGDLAQLAALNTVPEPTSIALLGLGGLLLARRRR